MAEDFRGREKREFLRYSYKKPLKYNIINVLKNKHFSPEFIGAISRNLSASGIFFVTDVEEVPNISSLLVMDLDYQTANICKEVEERALILNNKLIGRVVRIEDNEDGTYGIGVAFITRSNPLSKELQTNIESLINSRR